jgi:hypothetical protein
LRAAYAYRVPSAPPQSPSADPYQFGAGGIAIDASRSVASIAADPRARVPPRLRFVDDTFSLVNNFGVDGKRLFAEGAAAAVPGGAASAGSERVRRFRR